MQEDHFEQYMRNTIMTGSLTTPDIIRFISKCLFTDEHIQLCIKLKVEINLQAKFNLVEDL